ncbi:hypothetical protein R6Q59_029499, partial [Mikania micrantha]
GYATTTRSFVSPPTPPPPPPPVLLLEVNKLSTIASVRPSSPSTSSFFCSSSARVSNRCSSTNPDSVDNLPKLVEDIVQTSINTDGPRYSSSHWCWWNSPGGIPSQLKLGLLSPLYLMKLFERLGVTYIKLVIDIVSDLTIDISLGHIVAEVYVFVGGSSFLLVDTTTPKAVFQPSFRLTLCGIHSSLLRNGFLSTTFSVKKKAH